MANVLFVNPNKWGRGITTIWIATHSAILKKNLHNVELFDCTFYENWTNNETKFNTKNNQYQKTEYLDLIEYNQNDIRIDLEKKIIDFKPDIIFWSALSSHIRGEGEYVNIEYGYDLIKDINTNALLITGGIQATATPENIFKTYPKIKYLISGESEFVLSEIAKNYKSEEDIKKIDGVSYLDENKKLKKNKPQKIISNLDDIPFYDYGIFEDNTFLRPFNGKVVRAIDYELSRGCIYTCSYCVETVIQEYYGFQEKSSKGALLNNKNYTRSKSAMRIYRELSEYKKKYNIDLVRCQDTNFLTINQKVLKELAEMCDNKRLDLKLYIETRPEGINEKSIKILKSLGVVGVGMGIELAGEDFREANLNRFSNQERIIKAFKLLRENGILRTTYNIIGLPDQDEKSVINTIDFNRLLDPDNVTVAFYSPYYGTNEQKKSRKINMFKDYEQNVDGQLRSLSNSSQIPLEKLNYYKENFKSLVFGK